MRVQVNSDDNVAIPHEFASQVAATIESAVQRFTGEITRLEIHLGDVNAGKGGSTDKRCAIEARLGGLKPITVTHHAGTIENAVAGAAGKLQRALDSTLGRLRSH